MSASTAAMPSSSPSTYNNPVFWERLWRQSGINFFVFFLIAYAVYPSQPQVGAPADVVVAFYAGARVRILIAAVLSAMAVINLLWFAAALRTTLADAGRDGWGAAATASSAAVSGMFFLLVAAAAALAYSVAGSGNAAIVSTLNDLMWAGVVLTSFPRAMLVMSSAFGFWRAGLISNTLFSAGVAVVVLVLLGGTTWVSGGFWAPDGTYSRIVSPILGLVWVVVVSRVLLSRTPATRAGW